MPKKGGTVTVLASEDNADGANNLVTDDKNVYWTSLVGGGTVFKLPQAAGSALSIASGIPNVDNGLNLTATRGNVYFLDSPTQSQRLLSVGGGGGTVATITSTSPNTSHMIIADESAIYLDQWPMGAIVRLDLDSGIKTPLADEARSVILMAVEGNDLLWVNLDGDIKSTAKLP